jgi:hypothetical protein
MSGASEALQEGMAKTLRTIAFAMGNGVAMLAAISVFFYYKASSAPAPSPQILKFVNTMTIMSMAASVAVIFVSEIVWRKMLAGATAADVNARTQTAFIVRTALREGAALAGTVTFFLACQDGVLRAYPAYWVDLVPAGLFWSFLYLHWPNIENLKTELAEITS